MDFPTVLKVWLLEFFTGSRDPLEGHGWVLISKWRNPEEHRELQSHPLYGIKGWAVAILFWLIISSAFGLLGTYSSWYSLKLLNWRAFDQLSGNYEFDMAAALFLFGWSCMTAYWLWKKDAMFRMSFFYLTLSAIILSVISGLAMGGESAAVSLLVSFFKSLIFLIPIIYVFRSRRISVTCDDLLRHDDPFLLNLQGGKSTSTDKTPSPVPTGIKDTTDINDNSVVDDESDDVFEQALNEIENDTVVKALWAKALVESNGLAEKTKAVYIRLRVQRLKRQRDSD